MLQAVLSYPGGLFDQIDRLHREIAGAFGAEGPAGTDGERPSRRKSKEPAMSLMLRSPCVAAAQARKNARGQRGSSMSNAEIRAYLLAREAIRKLRTMAAPAPPSSEDGVDHAPALGAPGAG